MKNINNNNAIWFRNPTKEWVKGLPIGNGNLGAMIYGTPNEEIFSLNEDTLWSGYPKETRNYDCKQKLSQVRELIFDHEYDKAQRMIIERMLGDGHETYMPMGDMRICQSIDVEKNYVRQLDIENALYTRKFECEGKQYIREAFCSYPDKALVVHDSCNEKGSINLTVSLDSKLLRAVFVKDDSLVLRGKCPDNIANFYMPADGAIEYGDKGVEFEARLRVIAKGGNASFTDENTVLVKNADEVTMILTSGTSFERYDCFAKAEYSEICRCNLNNASKNNYEKLKQRHIADYNKLFGKMEIDFGYTKRDSLPTDERIAGFANGIHDPGIIALKVQFGRYLLIASSRRGSQPANLQGIWNNSLRPIWDSNFTVNINLQMNYWPALVTNLLECQEPFNQFVENISKNGMIEASKSYGCRGWCSHCNTDIWCSASSVGRHGELYESGSSVHGENGNSPVRYSMWAMSGAWLSRHLWEQYLYTKDEGFLREKAYPIIRDSALFMLDWLIEHNGYLVTCPATSPENEFKYNGNVYSASVATTMDLEIIRDIFSNCMSAQAVLNIDLEFKEQIAAAYERLYPFKISKSGQLQEWYEDYDEFNIHHRHVSHLYGLFPANVIPKEYYDSCRTTLNSRGEAASAWEAAWRAALWARLGNGERAYNMLKKQLTPLDSDERGCYDNLLDSYPPFQIDGNLGFTSAVAEMLLQSHDGYIHILPAIPEQLLNGSVKGLCARGGFEFDFEWVDGQVAMITVKSNKGGHCTVVCNDNTYELELVPNGQKQINI